MLRATLYIMEQKQYQCNVCVKRYNPELRKAKGCNEPMPNVMQQIVDDTYIISFKKCVGNLFRAEVLSFVTLFQRYETGVLPYRGALVDQPNKIIEIFRVIEQYKIDKLKDEDKRQKQAALRNKLSGK